MFKQTTVTCSQAGSLTASPSQPHANSLTTTSDICRSKTSSHTTSTCSLHQPLCFIQGTFQRMLVSLTFHNSCGSNYLPWRRWVLCYRCCNLPSNSTTRLLQMGGRNISWIHLKQKFGFKMFTSVVIKGCSKVVDELTRKSKTLSPSISNAKHMWPW